MSEHTPSADELWGKLVHSIEDEYATASDDMAITRRAVQAEIREATADIRAEQHPGAEHLQEIRRRLGDLESKWPRVQEIRGLRSELETRSGMQGQIRRLREDFDQHRKHLSTVLGDVYAANPEPDPDRLTTLESRVQHLYDMRDEDLMAEHAREGARHEDAAMAAVEEGPKLCPNCGACGVDRLRERIRELEEELQSYKAHHQYLTTQLTGSRREAAGYRKMWQQARASTPDSPSAESEGETELGVGCLPTVNQDEYPSLPGWWVQIWELGEDGRVFARIYGDSPEQANQRAKELVARLLSPPSAVEVSRKQADDIAYFLADTYGDTKKGAEESVRCIVENVLELSITPAPESE